MTASWARFAKAPGARFRILCFTGLRIAFTVLRARRLDAASPEASARRAASAKRVVAELLRLGPTYIKLGQVASCRPDMLAAEYIEQLRVLQDDVPADTFETVRATVEAELGASLEDAFGSFERAPLAAASLGQVHRATLKDGRQVVVKVQRPLLQELYETDLTNIKKIAALADAAGRLRPGAAARGAVAARRWRDFADEAARLLVRELDYVQEAAAQTEVRANFAAEPWVAVPEVFAPLSTRRVLTMEYLPGVKISELATIEATAGLERKLLAGRLARAFLLQFTRDGLFHTDPHPGNLACDGGFPGGRLLLYDFGQCSRVQPFERAGMLAVIKAILAADPDACVAAFDALGVVRPGADRAQLRQTIAANFESGRIGRREATAAAADGAAARARAPAPAPAAGSRNDADFLQLSSVYTFVFRALAQMGGVGRALDDDFDFVAAVAPFVAEAEGPGFLVEAQLRRLLGGWTDGLQALVQTPSAVGLIAERLRQLEAAGEAQRRAHELDARLARMEREAKGSRQLLVALAAVQLALLSSARVPQLLALAASARWLVTAWRGLRTPPR